MIFSCASCLALPDLQAQPIVTIGSTILKSQGCGNITYERLPLSLLGPDMFIGTAFQKSVVYKSWGNLPPSRSRDVICRLPFAPRPFMHPLHKVHEIELFLSVLLRDC